MRFDEEALKALGKVLDEFDMEICANSPHDARIDMQIWIKNVEYDFGSTGSIDSDDIKKKVGR